MLYLAYGSNMSSARMRKRIPYARALGSARLQGHELRFHKRGMDGSAKCDAFLCAEQGATLFGVLYRVPDIELARLDSFEGLGAGYRRAEVRPERHGRRSPGVITYLATDVDERLEPFDWYLTHVLAGAIEWNLPPAYIARIESITTIEDPDPVRAARERSVYS